jgi:hypothetical protein
MFAIFLGSLLWISAVVVLLALLSGAADDLPHPSPRRRP